MPTVPSVSIQSPAAKVLEDLLHALNQPLTHIRCTMELMLYRSLAPGDDREKLAALLKQAEKASKLSTAMQQVLEIEREHRAGPQRAALATAVETAFEDFMPLAEQNGVEIMRGVLAECKVAVSARALGIALFLLLDQLLSWARQGDVIEFRIDQDSEVAHLLCRIVTPAAGSACEPQLLVIKSICEAFGAHLSVGQLNRGLEVRLSLPLAAEL
jgi:signal transduction histidine kinase